MNISKKVSSVGTGCLKQSFASTSESRQNNNKYDSKYRVAQANLTILCYSDSQISLSNPVEVGILS